MARDLGSIRCLIVFILVLVAFLPFGLVAAAPTDGLPGAASRVAKVSPERPISGPPEGELPRLILPAVRPDEIEPPPSELLPRAPAAGMFGPALLTGVVLQKGNREPLSGVRVSLRPWRAPSPPGDSQQLLRGPLAQATGVPRELITDEQGRFRYVDLPPGAYQVTLSGLLLQRVQSVEKIRAGQRLAITYYAAPRRGLFESVVRSDAIRREVSETALSVQELKRIPGTQNDALNAVQNLPGVARVPFLSGLLVVWGSAPSDTRVYADGVAIPVLYHFGGLRATINSEFVSDLSFKPGAYGADFGRGLGGNVNVTTRQPKEDRIHGSVTLDLIDASVTLEGPLTKKLHFAVGARVSWIAAFLPLFSSSSIQLSPFYWDYQAALHYQPTPRDDLDLLVFGSSDSLSVRVDSSDLASEIDTNTASYYSRARLRWRHRFTATTVLSVMPSIGSDTSHVSPRGSGPNLNGALVALDLLNLVYNLRSELRHRIRDWLDVAAGVDFEGRHSSFDLLIPAVSGGSNGDDRLATSGVPQSLLPSLRDRSESDLVQGAPYAIARFEFFAKRLVISPQFRLDLTYGRAYEGRYAINLVSPEPRLLVFGQLVPKYLLLKAGLGLYSQLAQPQELSQRFGNPLLLAERGTTYVVGLESDLTATLNVQGQVFYKDLRSLIVPDPLTLFSNGGLGRILGGDFLIRQRLWKGLFGWVAYTVSRSERKDSPEAPWRLYRYDQTHVLTLIASYKLPWWNLEVGLRFRYATGNLTTPVQGGLRDTTTQSWSPTQGEVYSARLPAFQQLDLRIDKTWVWNRWKLGIYLDIQNLYNYTNIESAAYGGRQLYQMTGSSSIPFFPNLGLRADF